MSVNEAVAMSTIRVMVADDHPAILDAVTRFLELERGFAPRLEERSRDHRVEL